jgi:dihydrodipicolinate reductase
MGREVAALCDKGYRGSKLLMGVDPSADGKDALCVSSLSEVCCAKEVDCVVDFSHHSCAPALLDFCKKNGLAVVVATTGHTPEEKDAILLWKKPIAKAPGPA